jgi:hypothetical protein
MRESNKKRTLVPVILICITTLVVWLFPVCSVKGQNKSNVVSYHTGFAEATLPINLVIKPDTPKKYMDALHLAVFYWNNQLNCGVFNIVPQDKTQNAVWEFVVVVKIVDDIEGDESIIGRVDAGVVQDFVSGFLRLSSGLEEYPMTYIETVIRHELAHLVGVGHTSNPTSLMYPFVKSETEVLMPLPATDVTVAIIRIILNLDTVCGGKK